MMRKLLIAATLILLSSPAYAIDWTGKVIEEFSGKKSAIHIKLRASNGEIIEEVYSYQELYEEAQTTPRESDAQKISYITEAYAYEV